jgi:membrane-associated phospholipid phosphatase
MSAGYVARGGSSNTQQFIVRMGSDYKNIHDSPPSFVFIMKRKRLRSAIAIVLSFIGLVALGTSVRSDTTNLQSLDEHRWWIDSRVLQYRFRHRIWFDFAPRARLLRIEEALNFTYLALTCALVGVVLLVRRRPHAALLFASALVAGVVASKILKPIFGRAISGTGGLLTYTFPSGHLTLLTGSVLACFLSFTQPITRRITGLVGVVAVVAYSTLLSLTGSHFVTDCIGGILTAIVVVVGVEQLSWRFLSPVEPKPIAELKPYLPD